MNPPIQTYSFKNVSLNIDGRLITDYHEGDDVIVASRRNDTASDVVGADGAMAIAVHADQSGTIKFKLKQTSGDSGFLYSLVNGMQTGGVITVPKATISDARRNEKAVGLWGYVLKPADMSRGKGINLQEWTLVFQSLNISADETSGAIGGLNAVRGTFGA